MSVAKGLNQQGFELDTEYGSIPMTPTSQELARSLDSKELDVGPVRGKIDKNKIKDL